MNDRLEKLLKEESKNQCTQVPLSVMEAMNSFQKIYKMVNGSHISIAKVMVLMLDLGKDGLENEKKKMLKALL